MAYRDEEIFKIKYEICSDYIITEEFNVDCITVFFYSIEFSYYASIKFKFSY